MANSRVTPGLCCRLWTQVKIVALTVAVGEQGFTCEYVTQYCAQQLGGLS